MSKEISYTVKPDNMASVLNAVWQMVQRGLQAGPVVIRLGREKRSLDQNAKFHAMIRDIQNTAQLDEKFSFQAWKAKLVDEFSEELARNGEKLSNPGEIVLSFDKRRAVTIRPSTTDFTKSEGAMFITFLYAFGVELGARFSDHCLDIVSEARRLIPEGVSNEK